MPASKTALRKNANTVLYDRIIIKVFWLLCSLCCLDLLDQLRHDLEQVAHDAVVSHTEDRSGFVLIDCDDALRILHTSSVLDRTGDAQGHIDLGMDRLAGLTHLVVSAQPASVGNGTGCTHNAAAQRSSQLLCQLDALVDVLADAAAHCDHHICADQIYQLVGQPSPH